MNAYAKDWLETEAGQGKAGDYLPGEGRFKTPLTNITFQNSYLPKRAVTEPTDEEFQVWLMKRYDLATLEPLDQNNDTTPPTPATVTATKKPPQKTANTKRVG